MSGECEVLVLRPKRWVNWFFAVLLAANVVGCVYLAITGSWVLWLCVVVFVAFLSVSVMSLFPNANMLELDSVGFTFTSLFRPTRCRWQDVGEFRIIRIAHEDKVGFDMAEGLTDCPKTRKIASLLVGAEGGLPGNYGQRPQDLVALMNRYRENALSR